ncbi:MAG: DNA internalization-related competence protein ComEC/Rec2 [Micrococcaceae bacterium]
MQTTAYFRVLADHNQTEEQYVKIHLLEISSESKDLELYLKTTEHLLYYQEVTGCLNVKGKFARPCSALTVVQDTPEWLQTVQSLRQVFTQTLAQTHENTQSLLPGFLYGETSQHSTQLKETFRITGLSHISAVSGANCALILLITATLFQLHRFPVVVRCVFQLVVLAIFIALVRAEASALRAGIMAALALVWTVTDRKINFYHALACTILLVVIYDPWISTNFGFLLSCTASLALVVSTQTCAKALKLPAKLAFPLAVPIVTQVWCLPLLVLFSDGIPLYSIPANILIVPAVSVISIIGYLVFIVPVSCNIFAVFLDFFSNYIVTVSQFFTQLPAATLAFPKGFLGFLTILALYTVIFILHKKCIIFRKTLLAMMFVLWVCCQLFHENFFNTTVLQTGDIVQCDIGQGDAYLIATKPHHALMFDVGPEQGKVSNCLKYFHIETIDLLIITHFHDDHFGALDQVLETVTIGEVFLPSNATPEPLAQETLDKFENQQIPTHRVHAGLQGHHHNVSWNVLWPEIHNDSEENINNTSLVLSTRIASETGEVSALFTGDSEEEVHQALSKTIQPHDILKVPHHGSKTTSPELFRQVQPQLALISAGKHNKHKHPHPSIIQLLEQQQVHIVRSDEKGSTVIRKTLNGFEVLE